MLRSHRQQQLPALRVQMYLLYWRQKKSAILSIFTCYFERPRISLRCCRRDVITTRDWWTWVISRLSDVWLCWTCVRSCSALTNSFLIPTNESGYIGLTNQLVYSKVLLFDIPRCWVRCIFLFDTQSIVLIIWYHSGELLSFNSKFADNYERTVNLSLVFECLLMRSRHTCTELCWGPNKYVLPEV